MKCFALLGYLVIWNARIQADGNEWSVGCELTMQCVTLVCEQA